MERLMNDYRLSHRQCVRRGRARRQPARGRRRWPEARRCDDAGDRAAVQPVRDDVHPAVDQSRPRACGFSRRRSKCPSPVIRRWAVRTSCATCLRGGDAVTLEMLAGIVPVSARRRSLDAAGQSTANARSRGAARCAGRDARTRRRRSRRQAAVGRHRQRATGDSAGQRRGGPPRDAGSGAARCAMAASARLPGSGAAYARWPTSGRGVGEGSVSTRFFFSEARRGGRGPGNRLGLRQSGRLAGRHRRPAAAVLDVDPGRSGGPPCHLGLDVDADGRIFVSGRVHRTRSRHDPALTPLAGEAQQAVTTEGARRSTARYTGAVVA